MIDNVVIVSDFGYVEGGASNVAIRTAEGLIKKHPDVTVYFFCGKQPKTAFLSGKNIKVVCTDQKELKEQKWLGLFRGLWNAKSYRMLKNLLARLDQRRTVVHVHTWTKVLSPSIFFALRNQKNVLLTLHDYFAVCPNGAFFDYGTGRICRKKALSLSCLTSNCDRNSYAEKLWRFCRSIIQRPLMDRIDNRIVLSDISASIFENYMPEKHYFRLLNPLVGTKRSRIAAEKNSKYAYIGRLDDEKGVLFLARAMRRIGADIIFIGEGRLRTQISEILPEAAITGWVDSAEIYPHLQDVKCLIFPSLWYETFGMVVVEAGSMGIPSIVAEDSAAAELVQSHETGMVYSTYDMEDLMEKVHQFELHSSETLRTLSLHNYETFNDRKFSQDVYLDGLFSIYGKLSRHEY